MRKINNIKTYKLDEEIKNIDNVIFENIEKAEDYNRGFMSQNILTRLRNLIEHIALKILSNIKGTELEINYKNIQEAIKLIKNVAQFNLLRNFHRFVQNSVGHLTPTNENAERLMLKYFEYLKKLKEFCKDNYGEEILKNLEKFPLNTDKSYNEYYGEIAQIIDKIEIVYDRKFISGNYYVQKNKPFFINNKIYYEITLSPAVGNINKFDRITMFTKCEINTNYSIKISAIKAKAKIFGTYTNIQIINNWQIAIRPCEINNMHKIFGESGDLKSNYKEYKEIMPYLTQTGYNLLDLADLEKNYYEKIKEHFNNITNTSYIFDLIDKCRQVLDNNLEGTNILRYLLYTCNNMIIKKQYSKDENPSLSNLHLKWASIPFETMPFATALVGHNPRKHDLLECINSEGREDELLAKYVQLNTEQNGCLYTEKSELTAFGDVEQLVKSYNSKLYCKHKNRELVIDRNNVYMKVYEENTIKIIKKLKELCKEGIQGFRNSVEFWINNQNEIIDDEDKKEILKSLFENSRLALIYGSAGTGKTTMIKHISSYFNNDKKIYIANTHPAVENLRRKVHAQNSEFYTIRKILTNTTIDKECKVLIIDECSTVSNEDMVQILNEIDFELLILVGDIYQIESITFGNWFGIAKMLVEDKAKHELVKPYRSKNENLQKFWDKVRNLSDDITECIVKNRYAQTLDKSILEYTDNDEIILCLNYDGLYGINNINRFLQNSNPNIAIDWGIGTYKIGDPILFNESNRFAPVIYNNLKGKILNIELEEHKIWFEVEIDTVIDELEAEDVGLTFISNTNKNTIVKFYVNEFKEKDEDDDLYSEDVVPFAVAYAVSIHKAQGLEYNSVKIIITQEIEELISHNIFYTAITRAMEKLKIYWTPECQKRILSSMRTKFNSKDASIIRNKILNGYNSRLKMNRPELLFI